MAEGGDLATLSLTELLDGARAMTAELASRVAEAGLLDIVDRFPAAPDVDRSDQWGLSALIEHSPEVSGLKEVGERASAAGESAAGAGAAGGDAVRDSTASDDGCESVPDGSLPMIQLRMEELARHMEAARTALAGHVDRVFDAPVQRREVLGIPEGKSAYRNAAEYLSHHLRIRRAEARRRIGRARQVMARRSTDQTQVLPPEMPVLAEIVHEGQADIASVDVVVDTLIAARKDAGLAGAAPRLVDGLISDGERVLAAQVKDTDPDTVRKACLYWRQRFDALANPDGAEPTEAQAKAVQGLFYHGRGRANLHEWSLLAGDAQHEILKTIASAASSYRRNPTTAPAVGASDARKGTSAGAAKPDPTAGTEQPPPAAGSAGPGPGEGAAEPCPTAETHQPGPTAETHQPGPTAETHQPGPTADTADPGAAESAGDSSPAFGVHSAEGWIQAADAADALDLRTRGQRELDGLISALIGALSLTSQGLGTPGTTAGHNDPGASGPGASGAGGARPQVLVTIDYQTLAGQVEEAGSTGTLISQAAYAGPVTPQTIRKIACDADLIPVVLGGEGEVLDVGRAHRLFPRRLRRAITARDGGCAAPACSIPAPWCEVHHIEHWENGGPTSVDNGVLLCSHHHHAVHAGSWAISVRDGIPWFIPARHHDPEQRPRRNRYWRPGALDEAA